MTPERTKVSAHQQAVAEPSAIALACELGRLIGKHMAPKHAVDAKPTSKCRSNAVDTGQPPPGAAAENQG